MGDVTRNVLAILLIWGLPLAVIGYGLYFLRRTANDVRELRNDVGELRNDVRALRQEEHRPTV